MTTPTPLQPFVFATGGRDDWSMPVTYADTSGTPFDFDGSVVTGILYVAGLPAPLILTTGNGGVVVTPGLMSFLATRTQVAGAIADPTCRSFLAPPRRGFHSRLQVIIQNSFGVAETEAVLPIWAYNPATVNIETLQTFAAQEASISMGAPQGQPGASVSVNGHTGPAQNLSASDVGAFTTSQVQTLIAAALAQAAQIALLPPGSLEFSSGNYNPAWG